MKEASGKVFFKRVLLFAWFVFTSDHSINQGNSGSIEDILAYLVALHTFDKISWSWPQILLILQMVVVR